VRAPKLPDLSGSTILVVDDNGDSLQVTARHRLGDHQRADFPLTYPVETLRLPKTSWGKMSQIRAMSVERLGRRMIMFAAAVGSVFPSPRDTG